MSSFQIKTDSSDTLRSLAQQHLGDFRLWENIADLNNLSPFESVSNMSLTIPSLDDILEVAVSETDGFENLSEFLKSANNWKSLQWL